MENILYGGDLGSEEEVCEGVRSLGEALLNKLRAAGQSIVLVDGVTDEEISAHGFLSKAICLAKYLQEHFGIKSGDVISICSENRIEFAITIHAALFLGATIAPINYTLNEDEMRHEINLSKPKLIFVSPENLKKTTIIAQSNSFVEQIILYESINMMDFIENPKSTSFNEITNRQLPDLQLENFECEPQNIKENIALILCSSGTTGLPKGVQLTQFSIFFARAQYDALNAESQGKAVTLGNHPMFHVFGMFAYIYTFLKQGKTIGKTVLLPRYNEAEFLNCIQKYRVTKTSLAPTIMVQLAKSTLVPKYDLSSWNVIRYGTAPLSYAIELEVKKHTGVKSIRQGYGMTEGWGLCRQSDEHHTNGSVGVLLKGLYGRVVDIKSGKCLGPGQEGELQFKGPNIMKGYIGNKQATDETIDAEGWLHTGDIGYYDENGEWYVVDRLKELIKYKEFQVPPAEIEALLLTHPGIKDVGVIGLPNELAGEVAFAFVVKQPIAEINEKDVINYVAERLSKPKHLHGGIKFVDGIPKNPSGKILRRVLRDALKSQV